MYNKLLNYSILVLLLLIYSCANMENLDYSNADTIIYRFGDSSVPPPYHRSYTITASPDLIEVVVDSYGEIIVRDSAMMDSDKFNALIEILKKDKINTGQKKDDAGCTGGTTDYLDVKSGESFILKGYQYHCGGSEYGNLLGDLSAFKSQIKSYFENFGALLMQ